MSWRRGSGKLGGRLWRRPRKQDLEELFGSLESLIGEDDRLGLVGWIGNQPLLVQAIQSTPVEAFPSTPPIVQRQPQQPENRVVDLVAVDLHP